MKKTMDEKKENSNPESKRFSKKEQKEAVQQVLASKDEEIANLKRDLEKFKNEYYQAYADMQNLRKSIEKDHKEAIKYRLESFISELLNVLDSFHVALNNEAPNEETKNYLIGFKYIYSNLIGVLANEGVKEINPTVGQNFDDKTMHAVDTTVTDDEDDGKVDKVFAKGYMLHDHLVRPALVSVTKYGKKEENLDGQSEEETSQKEE